MPILRQSRSPAGLQFGRRDMVFAIDEPLATDWHAGGAFVTAWFNALSLMFPLGEKFFIDCVSNYVDEIDDPNLLIEISAFRAQESTHRRQHQRYNEKLCQLRGYDLDRFEKDERRRIAWAERNLSSRRRLAGTVASEHLTAIMAHDMLSQTDVLQRADPRISAMWRWHGIEESEHKAVAFDVFVAVGGTVSERRLALLFNTFFFFKDAFRNVCIILQKHEKLWSMREWASGLKYLWIKPGPMRRCFLPWLHFLRKDFHPWQVDNRALIEQWKKDQSSEIDAGRH